MRRLCSLQKLCRAKKRMVPKSVSDAVGLAVKLVGNEVVALTPGATSIVDTRANKLTGLLASTWAEDVSIMANLSRMENARVTARRTHENPVRKVRTATKLVEDCVCPSKTVLLIATMALCKQFGVLLKWVMSVMPAASKQ